MAHGKTKTVLGRRNLSSPDIDPGLNLVETKWEKWCKIQNAERALEDVKTVVYDLHKRAGLGDKPFASLGSGGSRISKV